MRENKEKYTGFKPLSLLQEQSIGAEKKTGAIFPEWFGEQY
jgi:hypothetical protein